MFKYAARDRIVHTLMQGSVQEAATALTLLPRLPSGDYPDDVAVIVAERA